MNNVIFVSNGSTFVETFSNEFFIQCDGVEYAKAIDPIDDVKEYTETARRLDAPDEATESDYITALQDLGVDIDE